MQVSSGVVAAAAVGVLALGGLALAVSQSSSAAAAAPPAIAFVKGHRYQVTLSMGSPQLPDFAAVQQSLAAASGGQFSLVTLTATATAVTYVVDAMQSVTVPVAGLQAGYNGAATGGISVHVDDLGPTPAAVGGVLAPPPLPPPVLAPPAGTPPAGTTTPPATSSPPAAGAATAATPVTAAAMVTFAQSAINGAIALGILSVPTIAVSGNVSDPGFVAALQAYQKQTGLPPTGALDFLTWADLTLAVLFRGGAAAVGSIPTTTDPALVATAQTALAGCVGRGIFSRLSYGAGDVNGQPADPTWVAALTEARRQLSAAGFAAVGSGALDYASLAFFVAAAWGALSGVNATAIEPATRVTDGNDVAVAAASLTLLVQNGILPAGGAPIAAASGDPTDPGTVAAVRAAQKSLAQLAERTGATGVLDYITLAYVVLKALPFLFPGAAVPLNQTPGEAGTLFQVTSLPDVNGAQLAMALMTQPGFAGTVPAIVKQRWSSADVGTAPTESNWMTVLAFWAASYPTGQAFTLRTDGMLDYPLFAAILVSAYLG
jgi:Putative peptidoglycan binding domain